MSSLQNIITQPTLAGKTVDHIADRTIAEPIVSDHFIDLPKTRLHYIKCGDGPPLVMVPATISRIENWRPLAQFMGQRFTVFFFELPGHGESTPFPEPFKTMLVAQTIQALIDKLRYKTISLMGFSFGGILAIETLYLLQQRVERMILLAPAISKRALNYARLQLAFMRQAVGLLKRPNVRAGVLRLIRSERFSPMLATLLSKFSNLEKSISMKKVFQNITDSTADVLSFQLDELLNFDLPARETPFQQPCYLAMSENDPTLNFGKTVSLLQKQFSRLHIERFTHGYHQPPKPITFQEIVEQYNPLLDSIIFGLRKENR
jgi:pimeloyl-ACP methyl ester carboxylesterase